jgi:hypothetical protein
MPKYVVVGCGEAVYYIDANPRSIVRDSYYVRVIALLGSLPLFIGNVSVVSIMRLPQGIRVCCYSRIQQPNSLSITVVDLIICSSKDTFLPIGYVCQILTDCSDVLSLFSIQCTWHFDSCWAGLV